VPIQRAQINSADLLARRARVGEPRNAGRDGGADRRIEPQLACASLARIPYRDNLLRINDRLALNPGAFCRLRCVQQRLRVPVLGGSDPWGGATGGSL
jgi:hypothetical protein